MGSINDALTIARSGVLTHQERMNVIAHNIANVDTEGYHRQQAVLGTNPANEPNLYVARDYSLGTGVRVIDVIRMQNDAREGLYRDEYSALNEHEQILDLLHDAEAMLNGTGDASIDARLNEFWASWQDLANNADRLASRTTVLERSIALTDQINLTATRLGDIRNSIADGGPSPASSGLVADTVDEINALATRIGDLNAKITKANNAGHSVHDLTDQRDLLFRELAGKADITVANDGSVTIDGQTLVNSDGSTINELTITSTVTPITFELDGAAVTIDSGTLGGMVEAAAYINAMLTNLDTMSNELITQVNTIHLSGYDLDGNPGIDFFTGTGATGITVNPLMYDASDPLLNNPRLIAAANTLHDAGPPPVPNVLDGDNALEIADLNYTDIAGLGNQTFNEFFGTMQSELGARIQTEEDLVTDGAAITAMLEAAIQSETGVNLDEEMMEMIAAQKAFDASARIVTVVDEMMSLIIHGLGA